MTRDQIENRIEDIRDRLAFKQFIDGDHKIQLENECRKLARLLRVSYGVHYHFKPIVYANRRNLWRYTRDSD